MSAFIVHENHIRAIMTRANLKGMRILVDGQWLDMRNDAAMNTVANILIAENFRSVNHRYNDSDAPYTYRHKINLTIKNSVQFIKALKCLDYQSCECTDYENTQARKIIAQMIEQSLSDLPGYDDAKWEIAA